MKLSFSTRGWPDFSWEEMTETAKQMNFAGIEVYNLHKDPRLTDKSGPFHKYHTAATVRQLREDKLAVPCLDSSCDLSAEESCLEDVKLLMEAAHNAKVPYVVVCALRDQEDKVCENLNALLPLAEKLDIAILMKTSGIYADTARLRGLLESFACDQLAALWDVHHPYRDFGESGDDTIRNLGGYVRHVHLRDSEDDGSYALIGECTMPIADVMRALSSVNYDGYISLEWKPQWMEDLQDPQVISPILSTI